MTTVTFTLNGTQRQLDVEPDQVSIKVKSADLLGAIGRGEGIAAQVSALLARS